MDQTLPGGPVTMTNGRTVLTTGANSGIGLHTAIAAARRGFRSVGSVRSEAKAQKVAEAAAEAGVEVETVLLDVTDVDRCAEVIDEVRPWGLVNNAGFPITSAIEDTEDDLARRALETMALAPIRLSRLALPHMRDQGGGRIVQVSSIFGRFTAPLTGWYAASKHALEAASDALRMEVAKDGIAVVLIEPGGIRTDLWEDARREIEEREESDYADVYERLLSRIRLTEPLMKRPEGVADVIVGALTTRVPLPRYLVGLDAKTAAFGETTLPTIVMDRIRRLTLGL